MQTREKLSVPVASAPERRLCQGPVMPIGGAEDRTPDGEILNRFVELAGGKHARILIIPTASETPDEAGESCVKVFGKIGVAQADWMRIGERADANEDAAVEAVRDATGIFITGGDQARLVAMLTGTRLRDAVLAANAGGVIVAGTSAGASILSSHALVGGTGDGGNSNDAAARKGMVEIAAGFGLLQDVVIDQHFSERGRLGRLLSAFAANPGLIGIGLDQDTAVEINRNGMLTALGSGMVTIIDGRNAVSDYQLCERGEVVTVVLSSLHVLSSGRSFDLNDRTPAPFDTAARAKG